MPLRAFLKGCQKHLLNGLFLTILINVRKCFVQLEAARRSGQQSHHSLSCEEGEARRGNLGFNVFGWSIEEGSLTSSNFSLLQA